jgi:hypothetical protein
MPLSPLTRLRAAIIVIAFAFTLFGLDVSLQAWVGAAALFVLPLLIWLLVSNAVKDAPPFDESAFHRTRPVTAGQVFRHLAGFHLLVLAGLLVILLAYAWRMNLGWREIALGVVLLGVPWIALVSLFATVASLTTSAKHGKGWGPLTLLLLPAISVLGLTWAVVTKKNVAPNLAGLPVVAAILYPALWWLVAAKGRWTLGCFLGLASGVAFPWIISRIKTPDFTVYLREPVQSAELSIQRLKNSADAEGMAENQGSLSQLLEIRGLGPDEFMGISNLKFRNRDEIFTAEYFEPDRYFGDIGGAAVSTDANGRLIPAIASLFHVVALENTPATRFPVWAYRSSEVGASELAEFLWPSMRSRQRDRLATSDSTAGSWFLRGSVYRWEKVLDTTAKEGGRAKLGGGGVVVMCPVDPSMSQAWIVVRCIQGLHPSDHGLRRLHPVLVARGPNGLRRFVEPNPLFPLNPSTRGFLVDQTDFLFQARWPDSQTYGQDTGLEDLRLELYWPVFRGSFNATLPPP